MKIIEENQDFGLTLSLKLSLLKVVGCLNIIEDKVSKHRSHDKRERHIST